jgi:DNA topoisomerase-1
MYERKDPSGTVPPLIEQIQDFARQTGLRYVNEHQPGYSRKRRGKVFHILDNTARVTDDAVVMRIRTLAIPPAWTEVWICKLANGHLQATGRDAKGRKQYHYHAKWNEARNETKFARLLQFGQVLPQIRSQVQNDLKRQGLPREKVVAAVIKLMELTRNRIGNDQYAQENDSYGLTTILNEHARVHGVKIKFKFKGKSGVAHEVQLADTRLSQIISRCQDLPGEELFGYEDEKGIPHDIGSADVNDYLRSITGLDVTAKDFRTWHGTVKAVNEFAALGPRTKDLSPRAEKARICGVIKNVASFLRNTVAICRKYYIHPAVHQADEDGFLHRSCRRRKTKGKNLYDRDELLTMEILKR